MLYVFFPYVSTVKNDSDIYFIIFSETIFGNVPAAMI